MICYSCINKYILYRTSVFIYRCTFPQQNSCAIYVSKVSEKDIKSIVLLPLICIKFDKIYLLIFLFIKFFDESKLRQNDFKHLKPEFKKVSKHVNNLFICSKTSHMFLKRCFRKVSDRSQLVLLENLTIKKL